MRIGIDGAALNQTLLAGIYNVTVSLASEMATLRPDDEFMIYTEDHSYAIPKTLSSKPNIRWETKASYERGDWTDIASSLGMVDDADIHLIIDGRERLSPSSVRADEVVFDVPRIPYSIILKSRSFRPSMFPGSSDTRQLGIAITSIDFRGPFRAQTIDHRHATLNLGFHDLETAHRWTTGAAALPVELFLDVGAPFKITIKKLQSNRTYYAASDAMVSLAHDIFKKIDNISEKMMHRQFERNIQKLDVFHSNHFAPYYAHGLINIATAYDIIPVLYPSYFGVDAVQHFNNYVKIMKKCDRVFCISNATRSDLIEKLNFSPDRVVTAPIDCDADYRRVSQEARAGTIERYGLADNGYLLAVGTLEPRKGHVTLIEAFNKLRDSFETDDVKPTTTVKPKLLIVGKRGWGWEDMFTKIQSSPYQNDIVHLEHIPKSELVDLYNGAFASVYISVYEGFGLPILESLACGTPVITSNTSSMPEVVGPAGIIVDPLDSDSVAEGLIRMYREYGLRERLSELAVSQRARYSWKACAKIYVSHIEEVVKRRLAA